MVRYVNRTSIKHLLTTRICLFCDYTVLSIRTSHLVDPNVRIPWCILIIIDDYSFGILNSRLLYIFSNYELKTLCRTYHQLRLSPSKRPAPPWILSMCFDKSSLSLNFDWQYGHSIVPSSVLLDIYELRWITILKTYRMRLHGHRHTTISMIILIFSIRGSSISNQFQKYLPTRTLRRLDYI